MALRVNVQLLRSRLARTTVYFAWLAVLLLFAASQAGANSVTNVEYTVAGGISLKLDVSTPDATGSRPVAIIVHGGGWGGGDKADNFSLWVQSLLRTNHVCFSINYRLAPTNRWPACFEDVQSAIQWVRANAAKYGGDPKRIALIGYSAGGHLATLAAVSADKSSSVHAVVGFAPPTDLEADCERRGGVSPALQNLLDLPLELNESARLVLRKLSPLNHVKAGLPPFLLIHGTEDKSVPYVQSVNFQRRLRELNVPCDLITVQDAPHDVRKWEKFNPNEMVVWLDKALDPHRPARPASP